MKRFMAAPESWPEEAASVTLDPAESHHAAAVLRVRGGETVSLLDGAGRVGCGAVEIASKKEAVIHLAETRRTPRPIGHLALAVAVPKGQTMDWIIEKAVELGVDAIFPLLTERTIVRLNAEERAERQRKWQRIAQEACKQCGQPWLPEIHMPQSLADALPGLLSPQPELPLIASLEPGSLPLASHLKASLSNIKISTKALILIGPEGDFTPQEYAAARSAGFQPASLGPLVLRVETAALLSISLLSAALGRLNDSINHALHP